MTDLNQIYQAVGGLQASVGNLEKEQTLARVRDEKIFGKLDEISTKLAVHSDIPARLKSVEAEVEDFRVTKKFVHVGMAAIVGLFGAVGGVFAHLFGWPRSFL